MKTPIDKAVGESNCGGATCRGKEAGAKSYQPQPVRRVTLDKPDGGKRLLGIPNLIDRLIQKAIVQILPPMLDPHFSDSSYGFRPKRSARSLQPLSWTRAAKLVQRTIRGGYRHAVDMDLSKFFDRVQHDVLMARVSRKVHDKMVLKLIGRYLRAGVMVDGFSKPARKEPRKAARLHHSWPTFC